MFTSINLNILQLKKVAGIELTVLPDNTLSLAVCILENRQGTVIITDQKEGINSIVQLKELLLPEIPVALSINSKQIINKKISAESTKLGGLNEIVNNSFPNINSEEFYSQQYKFNEGVYLSLSRKNLIDAIIIQFEEENFQVLSVTFGAFILEGLLSIIDLGGGDMQLELFSSNVSISRNEIIGYQFQINDIIDHSTYHVGEEVVESKWLLAYATAINLLALPTSRIENNVISVKVNFQEWRQKRIFKFSGRVFLGFLFILLFLNFLINNKFLEERDLLKAQLDSQSSTLEEVKSLESKIKSKRSFLVSTGWLTPNKISFYADQIAKILPKGIQLLHLEINPYDIQRSKIEKKPIFNNNIIQIKGRCKDPLVLNEWLIKINNQEWVEKIYDQNYIFDHKNGFADFELKINVKY